MFPNLNQTTRTHDYIFNFLAPRGVCANTFLNETFHSTIQEKINIKTSRTSKLRFPRKSYPIITKFYFYFLQVTNLLFTSKSLLSKFFLIIKSWLLCFDPFIVLPNIISFTIQWSNPKRIQNPVNTIELLTSGMIDWKNVSFEYSEMIEVPKVDNFFYYSQKFQPQLCVLFKLILQYFR